MVRVEFSRDIAPGLDAEMGGQQPRFLAVHCRCQLLGCPDIEGALGVLGLVRGDQAVGILRGEKGPLGVTQIAKNVVQGVAGQPAITFVSRGLPCLKIVACDLCLIVEHFLEMGDEPAFVDRVAMKASADVIVNATTRHALQRLRRHVDRFGTSFRTRTLDRRAAEQEGQHRCAGKFQCAAEAAMVRIEVLVEIAIGALKGFLGRFEEILARRCGVSWRVGQRGFRVLLEGLNDARPFGDELGAGALIGPAARDCAEDRGKTRPSVAVLRWKIGSAEEWLQVWSQPGA